MAKTATGSVEGSYRVLSLDGGGTWALIQVRALMEIYGKTTTGHEVLADFDLVAANSGGSIVLCGLVADLSLESVAALFRDASSRRRIFVEHFPITLRRKVPIWARYSTAAKLKGLRDTLPAVADLRLADVARRIAREDGRATHLLVVAYDYDTHRAKFFRTDTGSKAKSSGGGSCRDFTLLEAAHASSTAPVSYFDEPTHLHERAPHGDGDRLWDGGVAGYNNPTLAAVVEALSKGVDKSQIQVLSLGTGSVRLPGSSQKEHPALVRKIHRSTLMEDLIRVTTAILDDPPDAATFIAHVVLGNVPPDLLDHPDAGTIVRMSPMVQPVRAPDGSPREWTFPDGLDEERFARLVELDMDAVEDRDVDLIDLLADAWIADGVANQGIRTNRDLSIDIGQPIFSDAKRAWKALS